jgi:hypothetical protein
MINPQTTPYIPPDVSTVKTLNTIAKILAIIFGIILIIIGAITLIVLVGIVPLILGIINLFIYTRINQINALIDQQKYIEAKNKTLVWMIIGIIFAGIIVGILLLISFLKYDDIIRAVQQNFAQQNVQAPPPPPPPPAA